MCISAKPALFASGEAWAASVPVLRGIFVRKTASFALPVSRERLSLNVHCGMCGWGGLMTVSSSDTPVALLSNSTGDPYFSTWCERNCLLFFLASLSFCRCWTRHFNKTKWCVFYRKSFETRQDCCTLFKAFFQEKRLTQRGFQEVCSRNWFLWEKSLLFLWLFVLIFIVVLCFYLKISAFLFNVCFAHKYCYEETQYYGQVYSSDPERSDRCFNDIP